MDQNQNSSSEWGWAILDGVTMSIVAGLSLLLLIFVGYGEAKQTYAHFQTGKLEAQGRLMQMTLEQFLRPGLPLEQFVGFKTKAGPILASDNTIKAISAYDRDNKQIFITGQPSKGPVALNEDVFVKSYKSGKSKYEVRQNADVLQVILPLRNRFERVGSLVISMPQNVIETKVQEAFQPVMLASMAAAIAFGIFVAVGAPYLFGRHRKWLQIVYAAIFAIASMAVILALMGLYSQGAQAKTKGLADSLSQRISSVLQLNLNIAEVPGLDRVFVEAVQLNSDISSAALLVENKTIIHASPKLVSRPWVSDPGNYEYIADLGKSAGRSVSVAVAVPSNIVLEQTARSIKNFAALFVASAFLAGVFLQFAGSMRIARDANAQTSSTRERLDGMRALQLVKPVFFIAVLSEHLTYAFLPQFIQRSVQDAGFSPDAAGFVFTSYFIAFALSLVPAGFFAQHVNPKPLMYMGLLISSFGLILLSTEPEFYTVILARVLSGVGQGILFIGVQSYILATSSSSRKTQGAAIIVFGFQGGMISGMAIGSLLVTQLAPNGVFMLASIIAIVMALYTFALVPSILPGKKSNVEAARFRDVITGVKQVFTNLEFFSTILLIGIPAKAVLTGVVIFALPLLMNSAGYAQEDIGQVMMVYAGGVLISSWYISRLVDRTGATSVVLTVGSVLSGFGLILIGFIDSNKITQLENADLISMLFLVGGAAVLGIAHGFINAPVVTHVINSDAANIGESSISAAYRFLERIGHVAGPVLVGQMFAMKGQSAAAIAEMGGVIVILGLLFAIHPTKLSKINHQKEKLS